MKNDLWKYIATSTLSMLVMLGGAWFSLNAQAVTKTEVQDMIQPGRDTSRELLEEIKQLRSDVARMNREIGEIRGMLERRR